MTKRIASLCFTIMVGLFFATTASTLCAQESFKSDSCCGSPEMKSPITIKVSGWVQSPGSFNVQRCVRLNAAIALAGGIKDHGGPYAWIRSNLNGISLIIPFKVTDLSIDKGEGNPYLKTGDEIYVSEPTQAKAFEVDFGPQIYVVGMVFRPQAISMKDASSGVQKQITVSLAVAMVGGTLRGANLRKVIVIREMKNNQKVLINVDLERIGKGLIDDIVLQENDIVNVPSKKDNGCILRTSLTPAAFILR